MILVTGGAGYIGSHVVKDLLDQGYEVIVFDDLSNGHIEAIDKRALFVRGNLCNKKILNRVFTDYEVEGVIHFAAFAYVGESVKDPLKYYKNNVGCTITLLETMLEYKVENIVFSSTCAVYGKPKVDFLSETLPVNPINPYGSSKSMIEQIIRDLAKAQLLNFMILRYFNVAGADVGGHLGEFHNPETHLIPNILNHLMGRTKEIVINGIDYETPDGTCIRDYIHVSDLSNAHILALNSLLVKKVKNRFYNIGNEMGYSVKEIVVICEEIANKKAIIKNGPRRIGDPDKLVATSEKIRNELGWKPKYTIKDIVLSAWNWMSKHPKGYS